MQQATPLQIPKPRLLGAMLTYEWFGIQTSSYSSRLQSSGWMFWICSQLDCVQKEIRKMRKHWEVERLRTLHAHHSEGCRCLAASLFLMSLDSLRDTLAWICNSFLDWLPPRNKAAKLHSIFLVFSLQLAVIYLQMGYFQTWVNSIHSHGLLFYVCVQLSIHDRHPLPPNSPQIPSYFIHTSFSSFIQACPSKPYDLKWQSDSWEPRRDCKSGLLLVSFILCLSCVSWAHINHTTETTEWNIPLYLCCWFYLA